jgi:predicted flap endonuclease-1-like 5' DNA nuclease
MFDFTTNQWAIVGLVFVLGWLLGLFMLAGGRKWRKAYETERAARIEAERVRADHEARIAELAGERDRRIALEKDIEAHGARSAAANARIAELERRDVGSPITGSTAGSIAAAASGNRDDLARIYGVGRNGEVRLNDAGIHRFKDIVALSAADEAALEGRLALPAGTIADQRWREQAELLASGKTDEHARLFA